MWDFEYDSSKSLKNKDKHGICFEEAQQLWSDKIKIELLVQTDPELRFVKIAAYSNRVWTAVFTERDLKIRMISVRRARKSEVAIYDREKNDYDRRI
jgi:uncharacterized DUF497 family protein